MADVNIRLNLEMSPRVFRAFFPLLLLSVLAGDLASEAVTLNTYYPAPSGIYTQMIATGNTYLARDGGCVNVGTTAACDASGRTKLTVMGSSAGQHLVGIGTTSPGAPLEVAAPTSGNLSMAVNGQIRTGDGSGTGGVWMNAAHNQFLGTIDTPVYNSFYPFAPSGTATVGFYNGTSMISVNNKGYVGIGHTTPGAPLDIYGVMTGRVWTPSFTLP